MGPVEYFVSFIKPSLDRDLLLDPSQRDAMKNFRGLTEADGSFHFSVIPGVAFALLLVHPEGGRIEMEVEALSPGEQREIDPILESSTKLRGKVLHPGSPEQPATVELSHVPEDESGFLGEGRVEVDSEGNFEFKNIRPGKKRLVSCLQWGKEVELGGLVAMASEGVSTDVGLIPVGNSVLNLSISAPGLEAQNRWVDIDLVLTGGYPNTLFYKNRVPLNELLVFRGLPKGSLHASATLRNQANTGDDPDFMTAASSKSISGQDDLLQVVIERKAKEALGDVELLIEAPPGDLPEDSSLLRAALFEGNKLAQSFARPLPSQLKKLQFQDQSEGEYEVWVFLNGQQARSNVFPVRGGQKALVRVSAWQPATVISGTVKTSAGLPVSDAYVWLLAEGKKSQEGFPIVYETQSDPQGNFSIEGIPDVQGLRISASKKGRVPRRSIALTQTQIRSGASITILADE